MTSSGLRRYPHPTTLISDFELQSVTSLMEVFDQNVLFQMPFSVRSYLLPREYFQLKLNL